MGLCPYSFTENISTSVMLRGKVSQPRVPGCRPLPGVTRPVIPDGIVCKKTSTPVILRGIDSPDVPEALK
jgi:hypothetical protein